ncbi:Crp/Fnr family transcriptional regulator [Candidatus Magnetobacterium bavaricum]|uniref:Crp/Fnr family transcriptional regulator n=1 Tax=Candidatus Magnetobacterium bavaricum TaxID=29290 RepID=A0A0F3GI51_9BACT|nr:Crp/Fnr family transcriptional regulator [Candidatus Magnetobacterium bavaricum]
MKEDAMNYFEVLSKIPLFSSLSEGEMKEIVAEIQIRSIKKGRVVLNHEDANNYMYIVLAGSVKVTQYNEDGKEAILATREAGEYFGELSLIDGKFTSAEVSATKNSIIALIDKETFHSLFASNIKIMNNLLKEFTRRLRASIGTIHMFNHDKVLQRLRLLFEQLAQECGHKREVGITLTLSLTKQEIATRIGFSRQRVSEAMRQMEDDEYLCILPNKQIHLTSKFFNHFDGCL